MPRKKRFSPLTEERNYKIKVAVERGDRTQAQIAEEFGVSAGRVSNIARMVEEWLRPQWTGRIEAIKELHTRLLMRNIERAELAWLRSCQDAEEIEEEFVRGIMEELLPEAIGDDLVTTEPKEEEPQGVKVKLKRKGQSGNPAYLKEIRECLKEIREIWGANAPVKVTPTNGEGDGPAVIEVMIRNREELQQIQTVDGLQRMVNGNRDD